MAGALIKTSFCLREPASARMFPPPTLSVWDESKHGWVVFAHDLRHFQGMPT